MKLIKQIPTQIAIHAKTEKEAEALLKILHDNDYIWSVGDSLLDFTCWEEYKSRSYYYFQQDNRIQVGDLNFITYMNLTPITFSEFKNLYCEKEKFRVGDMAIFPQRKEPLQIHDIEDGVAMSWWDDGGIRAAARLDDLKMETKDYPPYLDRPKTIVEKELNLSKMLQGNEGKVFYSPICGDCVLKEVTDYIYVEINDHPDYCFLLDGRLESLGRVLLFPSHILYEQYPLDPYTAWTKWWENQRKYKLYVTMRPGGEEPDIIQRSTLEFNSSSDRDKCISEIKTVIEKYEKVINFSPLNHNINGV